MSLLLAMTLIFSSLPVFSAEPSETLSLPVLLRELKESNPELSAARKRWEAAQVRIPLSRGLPAPKIGVEFEEIPRGTVKFNKATAMYQLIQSLPFPGKLSLKQKMAVAEAQIAAASFKRTEWEVAGQLKSVYYDLFLLERQVEIEQAQKLWIDQAATAAQARYVTGTTPQSELLRLQMEALETSNQVSVLKHRREAMAAHLNHLLNRPAAAPVGSPAKILFQPVPSTPAELIKQAQENQPDLLSFKFSADRAEASWRLSKRELLPDLETMLELRNPAMGPVGPWDLSLAIALPFWFWTKQQYGVKAALYDKESAEAAYRGVQNEVARRIHENWHEAQADYETVSLCREGLIPLARQAVEGALAAYQSGRGSFMEVVDVLRALKEREMTYYEHGVALEQRLILLEQAAGVPLKEDHQT